ncbi:plasmid mobilization relaxosome protein MobC [Nonlabens sp. Asnod3-A02]|uniref:plasmid mobilization relaxosome protein MobC n=1 Tax=Nonlabens sp. Asnod3-A02 TaxID=3160579 RepID=UPI00386854F5
MEKKLKVVYYLSKEDKNLMIEYCNSLQIKPSFWIRNLIREKLGFPVIPKKVLDIDLKKYQTSLLRIGNNLNQIARKLNKNEKFPLIDQQNLIDEIAILKEQIDSIYNNL